MSTFLAIALIAPQVEARPKRTKRRAAVAAEKVQVQARPKRTKRPAPVAAKKVSDSSLALPLAQDYQDADSSTEREPPARADAEVQVQAEVKSETAPTAETEAATKDEPDLQAAPSPSAAPPAAFSGNSSASALWHSNNQDGLTDNDNYGFAVVRHNAMTDAGDTRISVRIDHESVVRNPRRVDQSFPDRRNSIRLERVALEMSRTWAPISLQIAAGDFYAQLGRGLVLALRRYDELGLDFALRGGRIQLGLFDDRITGTVMGGYTNINNIVPETEEFLADPRDRVGGAGLEVRPTSWLTLGAQTALITGGDLIDDDMDGAAERREDNRFLNSSGSTEISVGTWILGAEYAQQYRRIDMDPTERGSALFAALTGPVGPVTVLAEYKDYREYQQVYALSGPARNQVLYSSAPTAERFDQEIVDNNDVTGGRLRLDLTLGAGAETALHASYGLFKYRFDQLNIHHGYGGVRRRLGSGGAFAVTGGYRRGLPFTNGQPSLRHFQFEADFLSPLTSRLSMHVSIKPERVTKDGFGPYMRGTSLAELDWRAKVSLGAGLDWTKESAAMMTVDPLPTFYPFAIVRVRPNDSFLVQLFGGSQKGGLKCFAGVCRLAPPFSGARMDVSVRF